eukprot:XP_001704718.1 Hypothetical protein GL50803_34469 [Giardia lamblia ATCC 50803]
MELEDLVQDILQLTSNLISLVVALGSHTCLWQWTH